MFVLYSGINIMVTWKDHDGLFGENRLSSELFELHCLQMCELECYWIHVTLSQFPYFLVENKYVKGIYIEPITVSATLGNPDKFLFFPIRPSIHPPTHPLTKCLLNTFYVPATIFGCRATNKSEMWALTSGNSLIAYNRSRYVFEGMWQAQKWNEGNIRHFLVRVWSVRKASAKDVIHKLSLEEWQRIPQLNEVSGGRGGDGVRTRVLESTECANPERQRRGWPLSRITNRLCIRA